MRFSVFFLLFPFILASSPGLVQVTTRNDVEADVPCNLERAWSFKYTSESFVCNFRNELIPIAFWNLKVGGECYSYSFDHWLIKDSGNLSDCSLISNGTSYRIYRKEVNTNEGKVMVYFDYADAKMTTLIRRFYKEDRYFAKWKQCAMDGEVCCKESMTAENIRPSEEHSCPATWDAWSCFTPAKSGSVIPVLCPGTTTSTQFPCHIYGSKECFENGTWNSQTNYSSCTSAPVYGARYNVSVIVSYVSTALSFPAPVILLSFKELRVLRFNLHRNLIIACIFRNIFNILSKELVLLDALKVPEETNGVMEKNEIGCRILAFLSSASLSAVYACMFVDGFYLHKLIVRIFAREPRDYALYSIVAALSIVPSAIWATVMAIEADENCWMADSSGYQWIPDGFRIAMLVLNLLLMLDIFRVLLKNLRKKVTSQQTKYTYVLINGKPYEHILKRALMSTAKAMLFLMPLFGVPFILTANRNIVDRTSCLAGDIYYGVSQTIYGLQGVMVAIIFCYFNTEVRGQLKKLCKKDKGRSGIRVIASNKVTRLTNQPVESSATYVRKKDDIQFTNKADSKDNF